MTDRLSREEQRDRLLEAALAHVPFDGWSVRSLSAGARDLDLEPGLVRRLFPRGGDDLLAHLDDWADRQMAARIDRSALAAMRVRDRIATLVRTRLDVLEPHREAMRRAVAARLLPSNALAAGAAVWRTVDLMWTLAGDQITADSSYYTKRTLLAGVWTSTFLYWLEDRTPGSAATHAFLERRIDDVMRIGKARARLDSVLDRLRRFNPTAARR